MNVTLLKAKRTFDEWASEPANGGLLKMCSPNGLHWASAQDITAGAPKVAIVVLNYQTPNETIACIRTLQDIRYPNARILLVDNASQDDSVARFKTELTEDETELFVANTNGGYTAGNNLGIRWAIENGCDYVLLLNPDTKLANPDFLARLVDFMEVTPDAAAVGPRVFLREPGKVQNTILRYPWLWRRVVDNVRRRLGKMPIRSGDQPIDAEAVNGVCVLYRARAIQEVGMLDERMFAYVDEVEWSYRAQARRWQIVYLPIDSIIHEPEQKNYIRHSNTEYLLKRNTLYFLLKSGHQFQAIGYTLASLGICAIELALSAARRTRRQAAWKWSQRIFAMFAKLWLHKVDDVMGRPRAD